MSNKIGDMVYKRKAGSPALKSILRLIADTVDNNGMGFWMSKKSIAARLELGETQVKNAIRKFVADGLLVEVGKRPCTRGYTVVYRLDIAVLEAMPFVELPKSDPVTEQPRHSVTPSKPQELTPSLSDPVTREPLTPSLSDPKPPLEPPYTDDDDRRVLNAVALCQEISDTCGIGNDGRIPSAWMPNVAQVEVGRWMIELYLTPEEIRSVIQDHIKGRSPPRSPRYFTPMMQQLAAAKNSPPLQPQEQGNGPTKHQSAKKRSTFGEATTELGRNLTTGNVSTVLAGPFAPGRSGRN